MGKSKIALIVGICIIALVIITAFDYSRGQNARDDLETNIDQEENKDTYSEEKTEDIKIVEGLVIEFGKQLKKVPLLGPKDILIKNIEENYSEFVSAQLLNKWKDNPQTAPGRFTSSPWPDRIEVSYIGKTSENQYEVKGVIIEVTSTDLSAEDVDSKIPIVLKIINNRGKWVIDDIIIHDSELSDK